jgi:hypothetical protein
MSRTGPAPAGVSRGRPHREGEVDPPGVGLRVEPRLVEADRVDSALRHVHPHRGVGRDGHLLLDLAGGARRGPAVGTRPQHPVLDAVIDSGRPEARPAIRAELDGGARPGGDRNSAGLHGDVDLVHVGNDLGLRALLVLRIDPVGRGPDAAPDEEQESENPDDERSVVPISRHDVAAGRRSRRRRGRDQGNRPSSRIRGCGAACAGCRRKSPRLVAPPPCAAQASTTSSRVGSMT